MPPLDDEPSPPRDTDDVRRARHRLAGRGGDLRRVAGNGGGAAGDGLPDRPAAAVVVVVLPPAAADEDRVEAAAVVVRARRGRGDAVGVVDDHAAVVDAARGHVLVGLGDRVADRDDGDEPDRDPGPDEDPLAARTGPLGVRPRPVPRPPGWRRSACSRALRSASVGSRGLARLVLEAHAALRRHSGPFVVPLVPGHVPPPLVDQPHRTVCPITARRGLRSQHTDDRWPRHAALLCVPRERSRHDDGRHGSHPPRSTARSPRAEDSRPSHAAVSTDRVRRAGRRAHDARRGHPRHVRGRHRARSRHDRRPPRPGRTGCRGRGARAAVAAGHLPELVAAGRGRRRGRRLRPDPPVRAGGLGPDHRPARAARTTSSGGSSSRSAATRSSPATSRASSTPTAGTGSAR